MPGIAAIISPDPARSREHQATVERMVAAMRHDASYAGGTYSNPGLGLYLGWSCLPGCFTDCMPIWNESKDKLLLIDGEVYPDADEISRLRARGHAFPDGDASHMVHQMEEDEVAAIKRLNGFFAGIFVDLRKSCATIFNDRYGMQRLYYCRRGADLLAASEAKALLVAQPGLRRLCERGLGEWFAVGCALDDRSLFRDVFLLPGASMWKTRAGRMAARGTYFRHAEWETQEPVAAEAFAGKVRHALETIVPRYVRGRQPVAMSLTGGLDTRLILACAPPLPGRLPCYTFGGMYRDSFDVRVARRVAAYCGQSHTTIRLGDDFLRDFPALARRAVYVSDGNFGIAGGAEIYANRLAREIAPVRLTGNYGSEIMRGVGEFRPRRVEPTGLSQDFLPACQMAVQAYDAIGVQNRTSFAAFRQAPWFNYSRRSLELSQLTVRTPYMDNDLVALMYRAPEAGDEDGSISFRLIAAANRGLGGIPTDRGEGIGHTGAKAAIRQRYRWLLKRGEIAMDYGMPDWAAGINRALGPLRLERLFLGRYAFLHFGRWFRNELAGYVKEVLLDPTTRSRGILDPAAVERAVSDHIGGRRNHTNLLQKLISYEMIERSLLTSTGP